VVRKRCLLRCLTLWGCRRPADVDIQHRQTLFVARFFVTSSVTQPVTQHSQKRVRRNTSSQHAPTTRADPDTMWCRVLCVRRANQAGVSLGTLRGSVAACSDVVHAVRWPDPNSTTRCSMRWGSSSASVRPELVKVSQSDGVTTLCMNNPKRLNGWTKAMMDTVFASMNAAAKDETTTAVVLTGADPYYCAGVNLSDTIRVRWGCVSVCAGVCFVLVVRCVEGVIVTMILGLRLLPFSRRTLPRCSR